MVTIIMIDIHSHLLPWLDDGPQNVKESLFMAKDLEGIGFKTVFATPHVYPGVFNNLRESILESILMFKKELVEQNIKIDIRPGSEIFITADIDPDKALTLNDEKKFMLLELPFYEFPAYIDEVIFSQLSRGIVPIITHPERNVKVQKDISLAKSLTKRGARLQVNITSFAGRYGDQACDTAKSLLEQGLAHYLATDSHGRDGNLIEAGMEKLKALIGNDRLERFLTQNAEEILDESRVEG